MIKMTGVLRVHRRPKDGKIDSVTFIDIMDDEAYRVSENHNWNALCHHEFKLIEAWGKVYFEPNEDGIGDTETFMVEEFVVSGRLNNYSIDHNTEEESA